MPAFFPIPETLLKHGFWYRQQALFQFFFYLPNCSKTASVSSVLERGKSQRWSSPLNTFVGHDYRFVFVQKPSRKHRCGSWCVIMKQNLWLLFPQFCLKHHDPSYMPISSATSLIVIRHLSKTIFHCFNVFISSWRARASSRPFLNWL